MFTKNRCECGVCKSCKYRDRSVIRRPRCACGTCKTCRRRKYYKTTRPEISDEELEKKLTMYFESIAVESGGSQARAIARAR